MNDEQYEKEKAKLKAQFINECKQTALFCARFIFLMLVLAGVLWLYGWAALDI